MALVRHMKKYLIPVFVEIKFKKKSVGKCKENKEPR